MPPFRQMDRSPPGSRRMMPANVGSGAAARPWPATAARAVHHHLLRSPIPATSSAWSRQEVREPPREKRRPFRLAFPDDQHVPTEIAKRRHLSSIAGDVLLELLLPEGSAGLRIGRPATALVSVPETAVDEDRLPPGRETDVGGAGKVPAMQAVAESESVKQPPNDHLRLGVLRPDTRHEGAAIKRRLHLDRRLPPRSEEHSRRWPA